MEERTFGQIVSRLRKGKGALLLGAGCSASAGIFTAQKFADEVIKTEYPEDWEAAKTKDYLGCMAELDPRQRRTLIQNHARDKRVNLAHLAIASLIKGGRIDHVVTTNFDSLLIQACGLLGVEVAVYDVDALSSERFDPLAVDMPAVLYVHGQYYGFTQYNAPDDYTSEHAKRLRELIRKISQQHTWIVVGYSGENDRSAEMLKDQSRFECGLFWVGYLDELPCKDIQENLLLPAKRAFHVVGYDADSFFVSLARELGCDQDWVALLAGRVASRGLEQAARQYKELRAVGSAPEEQLQFPNSQRGLLLTLPPFHPFTTGAYATPEELATGADDDDFRTRAFDTNWGPPIVAVEHHALTLRHCWIGCTPQVSQDQFELMQRTFAKVAPAVTCHRVELMNPNSILSVQRAIERVYSVEASAAELAPSEIIADITSGLSSITGGIVLATLDDDRPIEYLTQGVKLVQDGRALTRDEIRDRHLLVAIRTTGEMVRDAVLPLS